MQSGAYLGEAPAVTALKRRSSDRSSGKGWERDKKGRHATGQSGAGGCPSPPSH